MFLHRTTKAQAEFRAATRTLGLRERGVLLLADGRVTAGELVARLEGTTHELIDRLVREGYLEMVPGLRDAPRPAPLAAPSTPSLAAVPSAAAVAAPQGQRSLAGTRMFLFDLCERVFARRSSAAAERFRQLLREAREPQAMLEVAEEMLQTVHEEAGAERAEFLRERILGMLPTQVGG